jgi:tetratricopeptide (TPR) repeat protein
MKEWGREFVGTVCVMMVAVASSTFRMPDASAQPSMRVSEGNEFFRKAQFIDAAVAYQQALSEVEDPVIHYNLGLTYAKIFKPGSEQRVLLGTKDELVCKVLPRVKLVKAGTCGNDGGRHYAECGGGVTSSIERQIADLSAQVKTATEQRKKDLQAVINDKRAELGRYTCTSSSHCVERTFCSLTSPELANLAAQHFQIWIKAQPSDDDLKKQLSAASLELDAAKKANGKSAISAAQRKVDDLQTKDVTRRQMTLLWADSDQFPKALDYWEDLLNEKPNDPEIMGTLAGINLKAGDWRKSIEWYNKMADVTNDPSSKAATDQFIGNVAWAKLNSRLLVGPEVIEAADRGIGALQRAVELQPKNPRLLGLQAAIFNFRSAAHGASWAAAIDRAAAQDLLKLSRVLSAEGKKSQGQGTGAPAP